MRKTNFEAQTSFFASSPFLILLGYFEIVDAAFLQEAKTNKTHLLYK